MKKLYNNISADQILKHIQYVPETGEFLWRERSEKDFPHDNFRITWNKRCAGKVAGFLASNGYRHIDVLGARFTAHRLAWFLTHGVWPEHDLDHINNDREDNRLANLRPAMRFQNLQNAKIRSNNTSGYKGVSRRKDTGKWTVRIREHGGRYRSFGQFETKEAAAEVAKAEREKLHGQFANHG